jgi:hypothetical protein
MLETDLLEAQRGPETSLSEYTFHLRESGIFTELKAVNFRGIFSIQGQDFSNKTFHCEL